MQINNSKFKITLATASVLLSFGIFNITDAATYYVKNGGNDSANGLSDETAWATIAKVNSFIFQQGDSILFKRGEIWRDLLMIPSNGAAGHPIIFGAYGSGRSPEITALNIISSKQKFLGIGRNDITYNFYDTNLDPDFEFPGAGYWNESNSGANDVSYQSTIVYSGGKAVKFDKNGNGLNEFYTDLSLIPKLYYEFTIKYRGDVGSVVSFKLKSDNGKYLSDLSGPSGILNNWTDSATNFLEGEVSNGGEWNEVGATIMYDSGIENATLSISINDSGSYPKDIYIDDLRIYPRWTPHEVASDVYGLHWISNRMTYMMADDAEIAKTGDGNVSDLDNLEWTEDSNKNVVWLKDTSGNPDVSGRKIEMSTRVNGVTVSGKHDVIIDNLIITGTGNNGGGALRLENSCYNITVKNSLVQLGNNRIISSDDSCHDNTIINNEVRWGAYWGIDVSDHYLVKNNTVYEVGYYDRYLQDGHCIGMEGGHDAIIENNNCYHNGRYTQKPAISLYNTSNSIVRQNFIHDNYRGGMIFAGNSNNTKIYNNLIVNNGIADFSRGEDWANNGLYFGGTINTTNYVYNNVIYNHNLFRKDSSVFGLAGILASASSRLYLKNNILYNNYFENNGNRYEYFVSGTGSDLTVADSNLVFRDKGILNRLINILNTNYYNLSGIINWDPTAIALNPAFLNVSGRMDNPSDFGPQWNSPAIDAGADVNLVADYFGNPIYGIPDIGAIEYQPPYQMGTDKPDINTDIRVYGNGRFRNKNNPSGNLADLSIIPASGNVRQHMDVSVAMWNKSGNFRKEWVEIPDNLTGNVSHTVGDLKSNTAYQILVDSKILTTAATNAQGKLYFVYGGGYSNHIFVVQEGGQIQSSFGLSDFINLLVGWLKSIASSADINSDGTINAKDLGIMMGNWE